MNAQTCFAIFVKTPGLSPIKTRLATSIGKERAEQFHRLAASAVAEVCEQLKAVSVETCYAVAESGEQPEMNIWRKLPLISQPEGGLGDRMYQVYAKLRSRYRNVFLIGADVPQVEAKLLLPMLDWLSCDDRIAIGPSEDGGFWCVGGNCEIPRQAWVNVTYSAANTLREFMANIASHGQVKSFASLADVDELSDLKSVEECLCSLVDPTIAQMELRDRLQAWKLAGFNNG